MDSLGAWAAGDRQAIDVVLLATKIRVPKKSLIAASVFRRKRDAGVLAEGIVVRYHRLTVWPDDFQTGIQRRSNSRRVYFAGNRFTSAGVKTPDVDDFARKHSTVDRYRQIDLLRQRATVNFLFDDLWQVSNHKRHRSRHALRCADSPATQPWSSIGRDLHRAKMIDRVVFLLLRIRQRDHRSFKPDGSIGSLQVINSRDAITFHVKRAVIVKIVSADSKLDGRATLATRRKYIRRRGLISPNCRQRNHNHANKRS